MNKKMLIDRIVQILNGFDTTSLEAVYNSLVNIMAISQRKNYGH